MWKWSMSGIIIEMRSLIRATCSHQFILLDLILLIIALFVENYKWWSSAFCTSSPLAPNILLSELFSGTISKRLRFSGMWPRLGWFSLTDVSTKPATFILKDERWRLQVPLKLRYPFTKLQRVTSHKTIIFNYRREDFKSHFQYSAFMGL